MLRIHRHRFPSGEFLKIDAVPLVPELQCDSVMHKTLAHHSRAHTRFVEQIGSALFEDSGAHSFLDVLPAPCLQHDRFDSLQMQKVGEQQPRRSRSDNSDLSSHEDSPSMLCDAVGMIHDWCSENTSIAIWNAEFAAGRPQ